MKGMLELTGIRDIKSIHSAGARSIPKVQRSSYLDLYMLRRERERLGKEIFALDKRRTANQRQLDCIGQRIEKLQKEVNEEQKVKSYKCVPKKPLRTLSISY